jgi:hypothetical protein
MTNSFCASQLKIERARKHISDLQDLVDDFLRTAVSITDDPSKANEIALSFSGTLPNDTPLFIGDAIHNARSALDILVCDIARMRGCLNVPRSLQFPISESKDKLKIRISREIQSLIGETVSNVIMDDIRPYKEDGDIILCALHDLDIMDKHKLLIPVISQAVFTGLDAGNPVLRKARFILGEGSKANIGLPGPLRHHEKPTLAISFDQGKILDGQPVIPTLLEFVNRVAGIVGRFENLDIVGIK